jgi:beta-N-acetylhexosaminidase
MSNRKLKIIILLFLITFFYSCSSKIEKQCDFSIIDEVMESAIRDTVFPGATLLFGVDQQILYSKAFGHYTYDKNSTQDKTNSIFDLASVSKVVGTTSAAMILVQEGKLNLDDKVIKYLPEFNNHYKDKITIRNLMLHNSGLAAFKKYYDVYTTSDEVVNDIMNLPLDYPPGEKYVYSDLGMITLQKVIEKISGQSLDTFLKNNLFDPLEMNNTMYNPSKDLQNRCVPTEIDTVWRMRLIQGEVHDERASIMNGVAGHAGLFSTTEDLSKFVMMYLNNGKFNGKQILDSKLIDEWTTRQSDKSDRGIGWDTKADDGYSSAGQYFSKNSFGHTGFTGTSIWVDKNTKLFVILLTNRVYPTRENRKIVEFRPILQDIIFQSVFNKN